MSWISIISPEEATGPLADVYQRIAGTRGKVARILQVHSLNPAALAAHLDLYLALMFAKSGLSRGEREAVAVIVSRANGCAYCEAHHAEALRKVCRNDPDLLAVLEDRWRKLPDSRLRRLLTHAESLTRTPNRMTEPDVDSLREAGLSDRDILDLTLVIGYFNFVNRVATGLGVHPTDEDVTGYHQPGD